jgi:hypothetical protein
MMLGMRVKPAWMEHKDTMWGACMETMRDVRQSNYVMGVWMQMLYINSHVCTWKDAKCAHGRMQRMYITRKDAKNVHTQKDAMRIYIHRRDAMHACTWKACNLCRYETVAYCYADLHRG